MRATYFVDRDRARSMNFMRSSAVVPESADRRRTLAGIALMTTSSFSNQVGAGIGALAFPAIGPAGVVAVRQLVAAVVLGAVARPALRGRSRAQWWPMLALAAVLSVMNLSLYTAVDRIGLALAMSLEFLGPLSVALAALRSKRELGLAAVAGLGVYVLVLPRASTDYLGVALALVAAVCWALYIVLNRVVGRRVEGIDGSAISIGIAAVVYLPVLLTFAVSGRLGVHSVLLAGAAGLFSSAVPYAADLLALRLAPAGLFAVLTSLGPIWAAVIGMAVLGQVPAAHEWLGIVLIAGANAAFALVGRGRSERSTASSSASAKPEPEPMR
jgi:inner membrane transporter RhtA